MLYSIVRYRAINASLTIRVLTSQIIEFLEHFLCHNFVFKSSGHSNFSLKAIHFRWVTSVFFNTFNIFFCVYFYLLNFNASLYFLNSVWLIRPFQANVHAYNVGVKNENNTHIFYKVTVSVLIWLKFGNYFDIFSIQIC